MAVFFSSAINIQSPVISGLGFIKSYSGFSMSISPGYATDSTGQYLLQYNGGALNIAANNLLGLNGFDKLPFVINSRYNVFLISDPSGYNPVGFIISLNDIPLFPVGYSIYRLIGIIFTNSSEINPFSQFGEGSNRKIFYDAAQATAISGSSSPSSWTTVSLASLVPLFSNVSGTVVRSGGICYLRAQFMAATNGNTFHLRPKGSSVVAIDAPGASASVAGVTQLFPTFSMNYGVNSNNQPAIDFITSEIGDALTIDVIGYEVFI